MKKFALILITILAFSCQIDTNKSTQIENLWHTKVQDAVDESNKTGKPIFAFFTGKEWCSWCKKLDQQILSQDEFIKYAKEHLILLELDFPKGRRDLPKDQMLLARKFRIQGYPTVILMDSKMNLLGKTGYEKMTPEAYISNLENFQKHEQ